MKMFKLVLGVLENNCYIVASEKNNAVVIDVPEGADEIIQKANENGVVIKKILLTHGHWDHIFSAAELSEKTGAKIYISKHDEEMLLDNQQNLSGVFQRGLTRLPKADVLVDDNDVITLDELEFKVMATPGHSKGSVMYFCGDNIFSGDTLFKLSIGRIDFYGGSYSSMKQSLAKIRELTSDYKVFCGHGEETSLKYELENNRYLMPKGKNQDDNIY